jgi:hypothetical protein
VAPRSRGAKHAGLTFDAEHEIGREQAALGEA